VLGHGLVREDMHSASISHLGIVVVPTLLALACHGQVAGSDFLAAVVAGYEVGARVGAALMDAELARSFRPTGITGPLAGAAAGARLLGLDAAATANALALAANATGGLNAWGHTGGSEMYFHPGFAARNAVTCVLLAQAGAFGSPTALDGPGGLFAAYGKPQAAAQVRVFDGPPEILAVYHKPVPACNFAQAASLASVELARSLRCPVDRIAGVTVRVPLAGARYPGCDFTGPFERALQAKMSIQYNVAAALLAGAVTEANFALLRDARLNALVGRIRLEVDDDLTRAYPARQGSSVHLTLDDGSTHARRLDDVVPATDAQVRARFRDAVAAVAGAARARAIEDLVDSLEGCDDAAALAEALAVPAADGRPQPAAGAGRTSEGVAA
jgi:2-methylcitrate dehydratase PrpD